MAQPITTVDVPPQPVERFRELLGPAFAEVEQGAARAREVFDGRVVWNLNSTARGGGVAEMLRSHLAYVRAAGIDVRWLVVGEGDGFFEVTKRIHNNLHGSPGDGGELGPRQRRAYEKGLRRAGGELAGVVRPGDVALLHDPQTLGLIEPMLEAGARVVWRCHVGVDSPNELVRRAWEFLIGYLLPADGYTFSRREYVWEGLDAGRVAIVPPSIDPFSPKNQDLGAAAVEAILGVTGIGPDGRGGPSIFVRTDGTPGRVDRPAQVVQEAPVPPGSPLVCQVSRWDRLKDPLGVIRAFAGHLTTPGAHLMLAGPDVTAVADDPEGAEVLAEVTDFRAGLAAQVRERVHLAMLPLDDIEENAAMVNAVQRRAEVVVQKSLAEGFGLTVSEAMWKGTPVVASRVGGIQDQIVDGRSGLLVEPTDLAGFAAAADSLLSDPTRAAAIGAAGRERVKEEFLVTGRLLNYFALFAALLGVERGRS
ncbi:MAG: glycosyltransferase [Solirubrobacterales bacterium]